MKKTCALLLTTISVTAVSLTACRPDSTATAVTEATTAVAETDSVDLGIVEPGSTRTAIYNIRNTGHHPLHITEVLTSCDCTQAEFDTHDTPPGETTTVRLTYKAESFTGFVYRTAEVNANTAQPIGLTLTATVTDNE